MGLFLLVFNGLTIILVPFLKLELGRETVEVRTVVVLVVVLVSLVQGADWSHHALAGVWCRVTVPSSAGHDFPATGCR